MTSRAAFTAQARHLNRDAHRPYGIQPGVTDDRPRNGCSWPLGDPLAPGFRFCDEPRTGPGKSYCAAHTALAHVRK